MSGFKVTSRPTKISNNSNSISSSSNITLTSSSHSPSTSSSAHNLLPSSPIQAIQTSPDLLNQINKDLDPPRIPIGSQVLVTLDIDAAYFVDLSNSLSPDAIKERIFAKLGIYDDDHQNFRISRCRAGQPIGQTLDDWQLWHLCMTSSLESDPPMLIVHAFNPTTSTTSNSAVSSNFHTFTSNQLNHNPNSSISDRESPENTNLIHISNSSNSRSRYHHRALDISTSTSSHHSSSNDLNHSLSPAILHNHHSPISSTSFINDQRLSPISNTPFELPGYLLPQRSPRPHIKTPDDWIKIPLLNQSSPDEPHPPQIRTQHHRRPSEPVSSPNNLPPIQYPHHLHHPPCGFNNDPRLLEYSHQSRLPPIKTSLSSPNGNYSSNLNNSNRRLISSITQSPINNPIIKRNDIQSAKSMEDLRLQHPSESRKWAIPGLTHPPLPTDLIPKINSSRLPPPLRISRNDLNQQRQPPSQPQPSSTSASLQIVSSSTSSSRPNYSFSNSNPNLNYSQLPSLPQSNIRTLRSSAQPSFSPNGLNRPRSSGGISRIDPRNGAPIVGRLLAHQSSTLPSRNSRGSLQIENYYLDSGRPPQRPQTGDSTSPHRKRLDHNTPSNLTNSDRSTQGLLPAQSHIQQAVSHSSLHIRPGDILQDSMSVVRRQEPLRDHRTEIEREFGRRKPNVNSSNTNISNSARLTRPDDLQVDLHSRATNMPSIDRLTRRPVGTEIGSQFISPRSRPLNRDSGSQTGSVKSTDSSYLSLSPSRINPNQEAFASKNLDRRALINGDSHQENLHSRVGEIKHDGSISVWNEDQNSLTTPLALPRFTNPDRSDHGLGNNHGHHPHEPSPQDLINPVNQLSLDATTSSTSLGDNLFAKGSLSNRDRSMTSVSASATLINSVNSTSNPIVAASSTEISNNPFGDCEDDDDEQVGTFVTPMKPFDPSLSSSLKGADGITKPKLTLMTHRTQSNQSLSEKKLIPKLEGDSISETQSSSSKNLSVEQHNKLALNRKSKERTASAISQPLNSHLSIPSVGEKATNRRVLFTGDDWAIRPPVDAVYENLEDFFPHHDLDKPIDIGPVPVDLDSLMNSLLLEINSLNGITSSSVNQANVTNSTRLVGRRRSIRLLAQEKKKWLRRNEVRVSAVSQFPNHGGQDRSINGAQGPNLALGHNNKTGSALLRRKSTKLWGVKTQEVIPGGQVSIPSIAESPKDDDVANFSFKWVKGELIGKGSFGQVFLALNATNGEMLAVKQVELPKTRSDRESERQNNVVAALKSEIHLMRDLEHPNIVQYLGFEETTVNLSIFLEYVPGGSVGRCLRRHGAFELNVIKFFTYQILEGLKYLHNLHILHRDLKADNLLVDLDGNLKISDFGISKKSEHIYEDNSQMSLQGSIFWMAPEVVHNPRKKGYSAKVDIWSLGCVVLEMFAGRRPWSDAEAIQAMFKLGAERSRPPLPADVKLGRVSNHFLAKCFIVDPELRPTADRLTDHLFLVLENKAWRFEDSELYRSIRCPH
ncbi:hypothetical protein O181_041276 [Austropuccinia psidii MF-1]|uniref:Protein kinase domain-containing protein n=1 Tax=Austropuccinia psidii MF-1 TaxID=1389203 RepID=A0A9Q3DJE4_9BASI|nr:hypothetical protein [Austropuccinia psidii MF-1]